MTIHKYKLADKVMMPTGAEVLTVQVQYGEPVIWALVNPDMPLRAHSFVICTTGGSEPIGRYVGTYQLEVGYNIFVGHVFQLST